MPKQIPVFDYSGKSTTYPMKPMPTSKIPKGVPIINAWTGESLKKLPRVGDPTGYEPMPKFHDAVWNGKALTAHGKSRF